MLISGASGAGKRALAEWLSNLLLCQSPEPVFFSADKLTASPTGNIHSNDSLSLANQADKPFYLNACGQCKHCKLRQSHSYPDHLTLISEGNSIGVDDVRQASQFLEKTAHIGHYQTLLIPDAETMTIAAANALLKTLEEPTPFSIIMLLSHDIEQLLPTIISRCRIITLNSVLAHFSTANKFNVVAGENSAFYNITHLPELNDEKTHTQYLAFKDNYLTYLTCGEKEAELLTQLKESSHGLRWLEKITCNLQREIALKSGDNKLPEKFTSSVLNAIYCQVLESSKRIKLYPQVNKAFILEQLIMSIHDVVAHSQ